MAELKPESVTHTTRFSIQLPRSSLTLQITSWSDVVPGKVQQRTGTPSAVTAIAITTWGRSLAVILAVLGELAQGQLAGDRRLLARARIPFGLLGLAN